MILTPINFCKQGINGESFCSENDNFEKQKMCYFFKMNFSKDNCIYSRSGILHCDNCKAQIGDYINDRAKNEL